MNKAHLKITQFKYHDLIEDLFSSYLVDVAYVISANDQCVLVTGEETENRTPEYKVWLRSVIELALKQRGIVNVKVEILEP